MRDEYDFSKGTKCGPIARKGTKVKNSKQRWFSITAKDLTFQEYCGSGSGGQHRNRNKTAIRCIHKASGAVGECEEFKSQKQNKRKAFERMAKSVKFQSWLKLKIDAGLGKVEIQEGNAPTRKVRLEEI